MSAAGDAGGTGIDEGLLELLRCPACRGIFAPPEPEAMTCADCGRRYPIRGGVPILLIDEAVLPESGAAQES